MRLSRSAEVDTIFMQETKQTKEQEPREQGKQKRGLRRRWRWLWIAVALVCAGVAAWLFAIEIALWRGASNIEARRHERALGWLEFAELLAPNRGESHFLLARCNRRLKRFDEVEHHLGLAHKLEWDVDQLEREQWIALAQTGQFERVSEHWAELFEEVGSDGPEVSKAYTTMCLAQFRFREADQVLSAWEKDFPEDAEPHVMRGRLSETNLNWAGAADHYRDALRLEPNRKDASFGLAKALINLGQVEKAHEILRALVAQDPDYAGARLALAQCQVKLDRLDQARNELAKVLATQPDNVDALLEAGNIELAEGNYQAAAVYLKKALELKPESREVAYAAARTLQAGGEHEQARKLFKFVDEATKPLIRLKKLMSQLLEQPYNLDVRFQIAAITWKYKSREEGARWLISLLQISPRYQPAHAALARHYELAGDNDKALYHSRLAGSQSPRAVAPKDEPLKEPETGEP